MHNPAKRTAILILSFIVLNGTMAQTKPAITIDTVKKAAPKPGLAEKVKSSKKMEGLFTVYQDTATGSVQLYIRKGQLEKEYIYQSVALGGPTSLFLNQNMIRTNWVFRIRKAFDRLEFTRENTSFYYDSTNAVSKAANVDVTEAVFYSDKIAAEDSLGYLVSADGLFLSDKLDPIKPVLPPGLPPGAVFNLGNLNTSKSRYEKIKSFSRNTDFEVDLAFDNPAPLNGGGKDITDARYNRIRFKHSFIEMPAEGFRPRRDDPRVGYFTQEIDNLTSIQVPNYRDIILRWDLRKKDPSAAVSEPVQPIVWWIENTTPVEYRETILQAGLKWNEAFEKAGFRNAIVMKIMPDTATWDPSDINYNVIRWVSSPTPPYGAIGNFCVNPKSGQIMSANVTIEWYSGSAIPIMDELYGQNSGGTPAGPPREQPFSVSGNHIMECNLVQELKTQFTAGLTMLEAEGGSPQEISRMHKQFLYYLILHEMGHTLGLNHNMKATQMLSPAEVNNTAITHAVGLQGSVMDYPAINIALDHSKQGDYYTIKTGPYDAWAIQFGYTPCSPADEEKVLDAILVHSHEPQLAFGNDADDMRTPGGGGIDPRVMIFDMSNDVVAYAEDRFKLVNGLMGKLKSKYSKPGRSYAELRARYATLNGQRSSMAAAVSRYVGGIYVDRSFVGEEQDPRPFTPVPVAYQKKAAELLAKYVFAPNAYDADMPLFPYLQMQRRGFNFFGMTEDPKPQNSVLAIQRSVLAQLLSPVTLQRVNSTSLYGNTYSVADILNDLTKAIFVADLSGNVNLFRQNIQTQFVKDLATMGTAQAGAYDDPSRAAALSSLRKIKSLLARAVSPNEQTKAHRASLNFIIDKALVIK